MSVLNTTRNLLAGFILAITAVTGCTPNSQQTFSDFPALASAIRSFSQDRAKQGQPLPISVSLGELVNGGYISTNRLSAFAGMETTIWLKANAAEPRSVLMSARLRDGSVNAALLDGSVQNFSAEKFAEHLKKTGQYVSGITNQPPGAGGSAAPATQQH